MADGPPILIDHPLLPPDGELADGAARVDVSDSGTFETTNAVATDKFTPTIGMSFKSVADCKSFYREYAMKQGFAIKTRNSKKGADGMLKYFILTCAREGHHESNIPPTLKTNPTKKLDCSAKITVALKKGLWTILSFNSCHNHEISPTKSRLFAGNKKIDMHAQRTILINDQAGVRVNKSFRSMVCDAGGYENLTFVERDVRNFVAKERHLLGKEGDGRALLSYFARMRECNKDFFYEIDMDEDFHVQNIFWADARSRSAYEYFGDVVTFDTTYLTNKYDMPFAPFVGVNHHGQSILLGCGLLSSEDTKSFTWLFETWLRCMSSRPPMGIVTDQCKAMQNAIQVVFPNTRHRWCLWHIMRKIAEKLKGYAQYKGIKNDMKNCVYDSLRVDDFVVGWTTFIEKYGLGENDWLNTIFEERERWVPCYLKNDFWAGMSTTQRSESMNAFFDGYINARTSLSEFVKQYNNALQDKAEKEYEADFRSSSTIIPCGSNSTIERQFQAEYTHDKYMEIQVEFRGKCNCYLEGVTTLEFTSTYTVLEESIVCGKPNETKYCVDFNGEDNNVTCTCLLFEFRGILCRHALFVLGHLRVKEVPSKFILPRWSKNVKRKYAHMKTSYNAKKLQPHIERFEGLCKTFYEIAECAAETPSQTSDLYEEMIKWSTKKLGKMSLQPHCGVGGDHSLNTMEDSLSQQPDQPILNPLKVPRKGRPRTNRRLSTTEKIVKKRSKMQRKKPIVSVVEVSWC
jgi:hypothetical protein